MSSWRLSRARAAVTLVNTRCRTYLSPESSTDRSWGERFTVGGRFQISRRCLINQKSSPARLSSISSSSFMLDSRESSTGWCLYGAIVSSVASTTRRWRQVQTSWLRLSFAEWAHPQSVSWTLVHGRECVCFLFIPMDGWISPLWEERLLMTEICFCHLSCTNLHLMQYLIIKKRKVEEVTASCGYGYSFIGYLSAINARHHTEGSRT